ncbi:hypothetical protein HanXRQr2_Chr05g0214101 [Helianthus annuus]|uniref:Uncharacterized protein n=1 Tax=Helianthus annuus TaxID=4232 RepID=A0A9K3IZL5_HELAN|nr:hypothetical protein HanXRQr2_Chr05g0214101 [Helianthus annuus]
MLRHASKRITGSGLAPRRWSSPAANRFYHERVVNKPPWKGKCSSYVLAETVMTVHKPSMHRRSPTLVIKVSVSVMFLQRR